MFSQVLPKGFLKEFLEEITEELLEKISKVCTFGTNHGSIAKLLETRNFRQNTQRNCTNNSGMIFLKGTLGTNL